MPEIIAKSIAELVKGKTFSVYGIDVVCGRVNLPPWSCLGGKYPRSYDAGEKIRDKGWLSGNSLHYEKLK